jgi:hypothetical protein
VVLQNNGGDDLTWNADGEFTFNTAIADGSSYSVTVLSQPVGQTCVASGNTGSVSGADVINVAITCTTNTYTIGGSVTGLTGSVVLQNNGGDDLTLNADTHFTFFTAVAYGSAYNVSVLTQPTGQTCTASSNTGTVGAANVNDVLLYCTTNPVLSARPGPASVTLSWDDTGATSYDLYYASAPGCDIANYASCADGTMVPNVSSPYTVSSLSNGQNYWFQLEAVVDSIVAAKGVAARGVAARGVSQAASNEVGTRPDIIVPDGAVMAVSHDATSGVTYLGGQFTRLGLNTGYGVPLNPDTGYPAAFPPVSNSGGAGLVFATAADGAGGYYIGGVFDTVGGETRGNLAHILADGTLDAAWAPSTNVLVTALAVSGDTVYVGGYFTAITDSFGTQTRNRLAAIDSSGDVTSWDPQANNDVNTLAVSGSMVYVGGRFTSFGGGATARNRLAAFDTSSLSPEVPTSWDPSASSVVSTIAVSGNMVYVGGYFTSFGGGAYPRSRLAAFDTGSLTPEVPTSWDPHASAAVLALAVSGDMVYAGGYFTSFGSGAEYPRSRLAAFDTGSLTPSIPTDWAPSADGTISAVAISGNTVYVGGYFTTIDDGSGAQDRPYLAAIGSDGTLSSWNPAPSDSVSALAVSGSTVYVGGGFGSVNSESRPYLAAVNDDGTLNSWAPVADHVVNDLVVSGSTVYVGGYFGSIDDGSGAQARNYLAAIGTDGTLDTTWAPTVNRWVNAIALSDSTVFVGGVFTQVDGGAHGFLAALDANGNLTSWSPSASSTVYDLAVSGNTVYVGGTFNSITDTLAGTSGGKSLAAFDATTGVVDPNWNPVASSGTSPGIVHTLAVSGSTVYVGGTITSITDGVNTLNGSNLAAIGTDGTLDVTNWIPSVDSVVYGIAVSGSTVYVGGVFANIDDNHGTSRAQNSIVAIGTDGVLSSWDPNASYNVRDLEVSDTSVYAGGDLIGGGGTQGYFSALAP